MKEKAKEKAKNIVGFPVHHKTKHGPDSSGKAKKVYNIVKI